jgi:hypothetical protein
MEDSKKPLIFVPPASAKRTEEISLNASKINILAPRSLRRKSPLRKAFSIWALNSTKTLAASEWAFFPTERRT